MPTYEITAPNGKRYQISGDGTQEQALAHFQKRYASTFDPSEVDPSSKEFQAKYGPMSNSTPRTDSTSGPLFTQAQEYRDLAAGAGKFFTDMGLGARQVADTVRRGGLVQQMLSGDSGDPALAREAETKQETDRPLMQTGAGKVGHVGAAILSAVPSLAIPGANTVAGSAAIGGAYGALQPTTSPQERAENVALGAAVSGASQYIGQKISKFAGDRIAARTARAEASRAQNVVRDTTLRDARQAGYVVPPATSNPTAANRIAESVSGKAATQQAAALRNQEVTNRLIRQDLGLAEGAPLTRESLKAIRDRAGGVYRAMKSAGEVTVDASYLDDLANITQSVDDVAKDFPDANVAANKEINDLVDTLLRDRFQTSSAVEYTKQLRAAAGANLSHGADPTHRALGRAQWEAAGALEDMVVRHLENTGKGHLASRFNQARVLIAKSHSVEAALNESTGNVNAMALARELKRGKPLSGGIEMAARFAQAFPRAAREVLDSPGVSAVDALVGGVGAATVNPGMVALPAGRIAARSGVLSETYQNAMTTPSYNPGTRALSATRAATRGALPASLVVVAYPEEK